MRPMPVKLWGLQLRRPDRPRPDRPLRPDRPRPDRPLRPDRPRPDRPRRLLAALAAVVGASVMASGCGATPYAAVVNSQVIRQSDLNGEIRVLAGNPAYVALFDQQGASNQIQVAGAAPGTYSNTWVRYVLTQAIVAAAVHQRLAASGSAPGPSLYAATRSVDQARYGPSWAQFPVSYRQTLVQRDAELALLEPVSTDTATLQQLYQAIKKYFFTTVCTRQVDVTGTLAQAQEVSAQMNLLRQAPAPGGAPGQAPAGTVSCYDPEGLLKQPSGFVDTVLALAPNQAAPPVKTPFGYRVIAVVSRDEQPFDSDVQRALSGVLAASGGGPAPVLSTVVAKTRVKVNPAYGTWTSGDNTGAFGIQAPGLPLAAPTAQGAVTPTGS